MELKFLGRGSAFNTKEGNTSAYIKENNTLFLIDCGSNIFERIMQKELLDDVKNVYVAITHRHPDHIGSLGDLIFYCFYVKGIKINIIDSDDTENIKKYLLLNGLTEDKYEIYYNGNAPELRLSFYFEETDHCNICKYVYENGNDTGRKNIFPCYNLILRYNEKDILYSGDTVDVDFDLFDFADEYYIDCCIADYDGNAHYNVEKLYNDCITSNIDISKVWCMHFDSDKAIERACELGFNVVTVE